MSQGKKFGTFGGVFTPSILTILGVIMYMRMGWVVGNAGTLFVTIAIIFLAHIVSITTGLSVSSVATDKKIKAGGIYYMLSRSLGFPIGGAIGVTLFVATALSIALYLIGFGESALIVLQDTLGIESITINHLRIIGSAALFVIVTIAYISTSVAIKTQYIILGLIVLSLVSIFAGTTEGKGFDFSEVQGETVNFSVLFGIFFPAVTGFTAGVAMSGDLKDPKQSIPWGTMLAVATGLIVYVILAFFIFYSIPQAELIKNNNVLVEFGWIPVLVIGGVWGATLSSALGGILGAPRILQAMSLDKITPVIFAKGVGKDNEPRNALILTFIIAELGILIGELNVIAEVVAMFYMAAYMFINLSCFLESWASPDFQPKFKISKFVPLIGTIATFLLMIQLNLVAALVSVLIMAIIFIWLTRKQLELGSGDVWQSVWSSIVKLGLKNLDKKSTHKRNWEPNILLFSGGSEHRPHLISFSKEISGRVGMISNFDLIENPSAKVLFPKQGQAVSLDDIDDDTIFHRRQECQNIFKGIEAIASTYGFSGIEPNTVLMGWARNTKDPIWFAQMTQKLVDLDYNIMYLDYDKEKGFGKHKKIDVWFDSLNEGSDLALQLVRLLIASGDWGGAKARVLYLNNDNSESLVIEDAVKKRLHDFRIDVEVEVVNNELEQKRFYEVVKINSFEADLIILNLPNVSSGEEQKFVSNTNDFLNVMGTTLLLKGSSHFYEEEGFDPILEKKYLDSQSHTLVVSKEDKIKLGLPNYAPLDKKITIIDDKVHSLNALFADRVYDTWNDTINVFLSLLEEKIGKLENPTIEQALEIEEKLLEDFSENRLTKITKAISYGIESHVKGVKNLVESCPQVIERIYTKEELQIKNGDSPNTIRLKKKLSKKTKANIRFFKIVQYHFENSYLFHLQSKLNIIGLSGFMINKTIKDQSAKISDQVDFNKISEALRNQLIIEKSIFIKELNILGRKFCNSITKDVGNYNINNISLEREEERRGKNVKNAFLSIATYPENWHANVEYMTNQLLVSIHLRQLELSLSPYILKEANKIETEFLDATIEVLKDIESKIDGVSIDGIGKLEIKLLALSNVVNVDQIIKSIIRKVDKGVAKYCGEAEVLSPQQLNKLEYEQIDLSPSKINVKKVADHLVENELVGKLKDIYQLANNEIRSEIIKVENSLRLIRFTLQNKDKDTGTNGDVLEKVKEQVVEGIKHTSVVKERFGSEISTILDLLKKILSDDIVISRADTLDGIILREKTRKGLFKYFNIIKSRTEKINNGIDKLIIKGRDLFAITGYQYRIKSIQNPHNRLADFVDSVSLSDDLINKMPFYYKQLFSGKHIAPETPLENRVEELKMAQKAITRFNNGRSGAILFTGDPLSGKSYLMHNVANVYCDKEVYTIASPIHVANFSDKVFDNALSAATGIEGNYIQILNELPEGTTLLFEDLELWWTRSEAGGELLDKILLAVKTYGHRHLFMFDCNVYFYKHIRNYFDIDSKLLATITVAPLKTVEVKTAVMDRHSSGGMSFLWKEKPEKDLKQREKSQLFKKLTLYSEGNVGFAFYMWLGNIKSLDGNVLGLGKFDFTEIPPVLKPDWDIMLLQLLLHKRLDFNQLCILYSTEVPDDINTTLQSLVRAGLVLNENNEFEISPYVLPYLLKYLRRKQLIE